MAIDKRSKISFRPVNGYCCGNQSREPNPNPIIELGSRAIRQTAAYDKKCKWWGHSTVLSAISGESRRLC